MNSTILATLSWAHTLWLGALPFTMGGRQSTSHSFYRWGKRSPTRLTNLPKLIMLHKWQSWLKPVLSNHQANIRNLPLCSTPFSQVFPTLTGSVWSLFVCFSLTHPAFTQIVQICQMSLHQPLQCLILGAEGLALFPHILHSSVIL